MKITDPDFPLAELLELIEDTTNVDDISASSLAILLGGRLTARDDQDESGNIVFVAPGRHDTMLVTFKPLNGGPTTTIPVTLAEIIETMPPEQQKVS